MGRVCRLVAQAELSHVRPTFSCPLCFGNEDVSLGWRPAACMEEDHRVCRACAREYVNQLLLRGGKTTELTCPGDDSCSAHIVESDVVELCGETDEVTERYKRFGQKETGKMAECPRCTTFVRARCEMRGEGEGGGGGRGNKPETESILFAESAQLADDPRHVHIVRHYFLRRPWPGAPPRRALLDVSAQDGPCRP